MHKKRSIKAKTKSVKKNTTGEKKDRLSTTIRSMEETWFQCTGRSAAQEAAQHKAQHQKVAHMTRQQLLDQLRSTSQPGTSFQK